MTRHNKRTTLPLPLEVLIDTIFLVVTVLAFYGIFGSDRFQQDLYEWAKRPNATQEIRIATYIAISLGISLFIIKYYSQFYYGLLEFGFAIASCWYAAESVHTSYLERTVSHTTWIGFVASIYLVVRGVNNIVDGWKNGKFKLKRAITGK